MRSTRTADETKGYHLCRDHAWYCSCGWYWQDHFHHVSQYGYLPEEFLALVERYREDKRWTGPKRELREPTHAP